MWSRAVLIVLGAASGPVLVAKFIYLAAGPQIIAGPKTNCCWWEWRAENFYSLILIQKRCSREVGCQNWMSHVWQPVIPTAPSHVPRGNAVFYSAHILETALYKIQTGNISENFTRVPQKITVKNVSSYHFGHQGVCSSVNPPPGL